METTPDKILRTANLDTVTVNDGEIKAYWNSTTPAKEKHRYIYIAMHLIQNSI